MSTAKNGERPSSPVLVVDDDRDIRETMTAVLEDLGYKVYEASNGREALHWLRTVPECMVVLLDLNMPIMDGFDVLRAVRHDMSLQRGHAFLVVTAYTHRPIPPDIADLFQGMSIPFVPKPFDVDELLDKVEMASLQCAASCGSQSQFSQNWQPGEQGKASSASRRASDETRRDD